MCFSCFFSFIIHTLSARQGPAIFASVAHLLCVQTHVWCNSPFVLVGWLVRYEDLLWYTPPELLRQHVVFLYNTIIRENPQKVPLWVALRGKRLALFAMRSKHPWLWSKKADVAPQTCAGAWHQLRRQSAVRLGVRELLYFVQRLTLVGPCVSLRIEHKCDSFAFVFQSFYFHSRCFASPWSRTCCVVLSTSI